MIYNFNARMLSLRLKLNNNKRGYIMQSSSDPNIALLNDRFPNFTVEIIPNTFNKQLAEYYISLPKDQEKDMRFFSTWLHEKGQISGQSGGKKFVGSHTEDKKKIGIILTKENCKVIQKNTKLSELELISIKNFANRLVEESPKEGNRSMRL